MLHGLARTNWSWLFSLIGVAILTSAPVRAQGTLQSPEPNRNTIRQLPQEAPLPNSQRSPQADPHGSMPPASRQPHAVRLSDQSPSVRPMSNVDPWLASPQSPSPNFPAPNIPAPNSSTPILSPSTIQNETVSSKVEPQRSTHETASPSVGSGLVVPAAWQDRVPRATTLANSSGPTGANGTSNTNGLSLEESKKTGALTLKPPRSESEGTIEKPRSPWASLISMVASLCVVIGLFLGLAWTLRRTTGQPFGSLPKEVVQILGRTAMAPRQQVYLLRFGSKLILVSHQLGQTETLSEIEDPLEVDRLSGLCEQNASGSVTQSFRQVFQQVALGQSVPTRKTKLRSQA